MIAGFQFVDEHLTGPFGHGVVAAGEHVNGRIARFRPGVNRDVGFGQQGQTGHALGFEMMGDQMEQGGASTFCSAGDGVPEKGFVVEPLVVAVVELEDAVLAHGVRHGGLGGFQGGREVVGEVAGRPSGVGMKAGEGLGHQDVMHTSLSP